MPSNGTPPPHLGGAHVAADAVDLDGAIADGEDAPAAADELLPDDTLDTPDRDTDGSLVGRADADADAER